MKILVIIPSLQRGGAERVVSRLTQIWQETHEVLIAVFDSSEIAYLYAGNLVDLKCPSLNSVWGKVINSFRRVLRLATLIRTEKPDRIIGFMESANFPAILSASMLGALDRLSVSVRDDPEWFVLTYRYLIPWLYRLPKRVVGVSQGVSFALKKMGVPRQKLFFIHNPALKDLKKVENKSGENVCRPPRYILGVGRLHPQKGFDRLMTAFAGIDDPELHLVILGEGQERANLEALAEKLRISTRLMMPGAVADVSSWYENALCFVLSSRHEGFSNVLIEAMQWRCPVISFDCRFGPNEVIEHEASGFLIPEGDVDALRMAMVEVVGNDVLREKKKKNSLCALKKFDANRIANAWLD
jgi:glycosyltransferase involved in cell wall biosynthesis